MKKGIGNGYGIGDKNKIKEQIDQRFRVNLDENNEFGHAGSIQNSGIGSKSTQTIFENSNWLKTAEAAEYLRTSQKQLRNWVYQGKVKTYRLFGRSLRFKRSDLDILHKLGGHSWQ